MEEDNIMGRLPRVQAEESSQQTDQFENAYSSYQREQVDDDILRRSNYEESSMTSSEVNQRDPRVSRDFGR